MSKTRGAIRFIAMLIVTLPAVPMLAPYLAFGGLMWFLGLKVFKSNSMAQYGKNITITVDQFFATVMMGASPDVTISSELGYARKRYNEGSASLSVGWLMFGAFVNNLFWHQADHTLEAIEHDEDSKDRAFKIYDSIAPQEMEKDDDDILYQS